ncbi:MAG: hypothetical protein HFJ51_06890 [Clostridia bacterium]|nr:hypothetical protein [Clostridia bacterium]
MKYIEKFYKKILLLINPPKNIERVKDKYTISEIFPSKGMMEDALKSALK